MKKTFHSLLICCMLLLPVIALLSSCKKDHSTPYIPEAPLVMKSFHPATAAKDSIVVILGSGFNRDASKDTVLFNNKKAIIVSATDTTLTVRVPQGVAENILSVPGGLIENAASILVKVGKKTATVSDLFFYLYTVSTVAGDGQPGLRNDVGTHAEFNAPSGVALDGAGNIYVADAGNHVIRKITTTGQVSTLAGDGVAGFNDASGTAARFNTPKGIAVDGAGNIYVADAGNNRIRKITPAGLVSTIAGNGNAGLVNAMGTAAELNTPQSVAVDASGNIFFSDAGNYMIRRIASDGMVSTLSGNGMPGFLDAKANAALFSSTMGIASTTQSLLFIVDAGNNRLRVLSSGKRPDTVYTVAGQTTAGFMDGYDQPRFNNPMGIAIDYHGDNPEFIIGDTYNHRIRKCDYSGLVTTLAGNGTPGFTNGLSNAATFNSPVGIAVDAAGVIYVADQGNHSIRKVE